LTCSYPHAEAGALIPFSRKKILDKAQQKAIQKDNTNLRIMMFHTVDGNLNIYFHICNYEAMDELKKQS
jgi:hypothetical protein